MICTWCGAPLRENARFCGACGKPVTTSSAPPPLSRAAELRALLPALTGLDARYVRALQALADAPVGAPARVVLVGEQGRGRTTVARWLLQTPDLPLHGGPAGQPTVHTAAHYVLVDLPGANDAADTFDQVIAPELLQADVALICVSAAQLLSESERRLIEQQILPLCGGEVVLVVTHADELETDEDRQDVEVRVQRFLGRIGAHPWFLFAPTAPGPLRTYLQVRVEGIDAARAWTRKVDRLLGALEAQLPEPAAPQLDYADLEAALQQEVRLAQAETLALLRVRLAALRVQLPEQLAALPVSRLQGEGPQILAREAEKLAEELRVCLLGSLERELCATPDSPLHGAARGLGAQPTPELKEHPAAPSVDTRRPRDWRSIVLAVAGLTALITGGGSLVLGGGALLLIGAWTTRKSQEKEFLQRLATDARAATRQWLDALEPELQQRIEAVAAETHQQLRARLQSLLPPPPPPVAGLRVALARCRKNLE